MTARFLLPALLLMSTAFPVNAGGLAATVTETVVIDEVEPTMSSANGLIIPLIIVALIALAANSNSDSDDGGTAASDMRLKTDILRIGTSASGLGIYQFRYLGDDQLYQGVMAQEVQHVVPDAVILNPAGYLSVNYALIDVPFVALD
jgi:hypothetical protein